MYYIGIKPWNDLKTFIPVDKTVVAIDDTGA